MITRREFVKRTGTVAAVSTVGLAPVFSTCINSKNKPMKQVSIRNVDSNFEREPLIRPFGFKGGYMSEIWQTMSWLQSESGINKVGLCTQNVLWSDASVFAAHSEAGGNSLMYLLTERAMQMVKGLTFSSPVSLLDTILEELYEYGVKITGNPHLRKTFALNALVGLDNAAWLLYAAENDIPAITLFVNPNNHLAIKLYESFGFTDVGYSKTGSLKMQLKINNSKNQ